MDVCETIVQVAEQHYTPPRHTETASFNLINVTLAWRIVLTLTSKKLKPGQPGTKRLVTQYGARLVCVRYRYDAEQCKRFKTVKLIVEESLWQPPAKAIPDDEIVGLRVGLREVDLQRRVKTPGGKWNPGRRVWEIRYGQVVSIGLTDRIELRNVSDNGKPNVSIIRK